jgi:membrane-bound lytic murein transglycosylase D
MYRAYISQLIAWNNLKDADVTPGQKLVVFGTSGNVTPSRTELAKDEGRASEDARKTIVRHKVRRGDTLVSIARTYHTTIQRLVALNNLRGRTKLAKGERLKVEQELSIKKSRSSSRKVSAVKHQKVKKERSSRHARKRRR